MRLTLVQERGWYAAALLALILVVARGHEKRLRGAYATQNTWLKLNRSDMIIKYFECSEDSPSGPPDVSSGGPAPSIEP
jgi:hypothetical protein